MKKLICVKTGNWSYCTESRYAKLVEKFGSEENLRTQWMSRIGKKMSNSAEVAAPSEFKNKIRCSVTGQLYQISDDRIGKMIAKANGDEVAARASFICRVAKRLMKAGKTVDEIKAMVANGTLPAPVSK